MLRGESAPLGGAAGVSTAAVSGACSTCEALASSMRSSRAPPTSDCQRSCTVGPRAQLEHQPKCPSAMHAGAQRAHQRISRYHRQTRATARAGQIDDQALGCGQSQVPLLHRARELQRQRRLSGIAGKREALDDDLSVGYGRMGSQRGARKAERPRQHRDPCRDRRPSGYPCSAIRSALHPVGPRRSHCRADSKRCRFLFQHNDGDTPRSSDVF